MQPSFHVSFKHRETHMKKLSNSRVWFILVV
jgi:hypothetical protein